MEKKSQLMILATGAVIGAIGALFLAPQSGRKTREQLAKQTQWAGRKFGELGRGIAGQAKRITDREAVHNGSDYTDALGRGSSRGRTAMVIVGVLAAVSSSLLFAPRSGKESRRWLANQMRTGRDRFNEAVQKVRSDAQEGTQGARDTVKENGQSIGDTAQHVSDTGSEIYEHVR